MQRKDDRKERVITAEKYWAQAHLDFDIPALAGLMAPEYRRIDNQGNLLDKSATLQAYGTGMRSWEVAESSDLEIQLHGPIAIVTGLWHGVGINNGDKFDYKARFMTIYLERDDRWLLLAEKSTPLAQGLNQDLIELAQGGNGEQI